MSIAEICIGVLDIQGSVEEHLAALEKLGVKHMAVKTPLDLEKADGLIIPGGESTVIGKLMKMYGLDEAIHKRMAPAVSRLAAAAKKPLAIWGTCAGAILLAKKVSNCPPASLQLMDISIIRNAYGRQIDSFETELRIPILGDRPFPAVFIRAPQVEKTSHAVKVLAEYGGRPVMLRQGNMLVTTFHPELTSDTRVHLYFYNLVKKALK